MIKRTALILIAGFVCTTQLSAQQNTAYQKPPQSLISLLEAPLSPGVRISSDGEWMLLLEMSGLPTINELSEPEYRLAGLRIDPVTNGPSRSTYFKGIKLKSLSTSQESVFTGLPADARLSDITWSPDETKIAFTHTSQTGIELWVVDLKSLAAKRLGKEHINKTYGKIFVWNPDGKTILAQFVDPKRTALTEPKLIPPGPVIQENIGKSTPAPTYQDLLKSPYDEMAFDHFLTSQLKLVSMEGESSNFLQPQIIRSFDYSPDGKYILLSNINHPYSYTVPISLFPFTTNVYDDKGKLVKKFFDAPLAENIPAGFDGVPKGPREFG